MAGTVSGRRVLVGKPDFLRENGVTDIAALETLAAPRQAEGATAIFVAIDGRATGVLTVADPVKATTSQALAELHELGVNVLMLVIASSCTLLLQRFVASRQLARRQQRTA